jgi:acyl-CoA synthetase (AMP-forming)/AMP-acid ligase II
VRVPTIKPLKTAGARFLSSGSALPRDIADSFHERFGIRLLSCYHGTQAGPLAIDRAGKEPETVGRAFDGVEVRVAGAKGDRLPAGDDRPDLGALQDAVDAVGAEDSTCPSGTKASRSAASGRTAGTAPAISDRLDKNGA